MKKSMRLILDANEYIFGFNEPSNETGPIELINRLPHLIDEIEDFHLFVPEIIREEVQRNLSPPFLDSFYRFVGSSPKVIYGSLFEVPYTLFEKYHIRQGLKEADATIAAFAEWKEVDYLVSENRHIYEELQVVEFITCAAEDFVHLLDSGQIWAAIAEVRARRSV